MKYLPGILSAASVPSVNYNSFYQGEYGEVV